MPKQNYENKVIEKFMKVVPKDILPDQIKSGHRTENRINFKACDGSNLQFQYGDLRVELKDGRTVILEVEGMGGVTNLMKYWYILVSDIFDKKPSKLYLLHLYHKPTPKNYESHLMLWSFLKQKMEKELGDSVKLECMTYKNVDASDPHFQEALKLFGGWLKKP